MRRERCLSADAASDPATKQRSQLVCEPVHRGEVPNRVRLHSYIASAQEGYVAALKDVHVCAAGRPA